MKRLVGLAVLAGAVALVAGLARSAPQPSVVSLAWELQFDYQTPAPIRLDVPGEGKQTYWYVLFTVTNKTGADRMFVPDFTLYTDTGQVLRGGKDISPSVFQAIVTRHNNPLLEDLSEITGPILQGADNARDGVAIFRDIDPQARSFDIFIGGLSGETAVVKLPMPIAVEEPTIEGKVVTVTKDSIILHKTRQLRFALPGEAGARLNARPRMIEDGWVMR
jgi:hypothetical protein